MLIEKHKQVKQEFEDYKQSFGAGTTNKTSNVFAYNNQQQIPMGNSASQTSALRNAPLYSHLQA